MITWLAQINEIGDRAVNALKFDEIISFPREISENDLLPAQIFI